jgi:hypothetical protein
MICEPKGQNENAQHIAFVTCTLICMPWQVYILTPTDRSLININLTVGLHACQKKLVKKKQLGYMLD